MFGEIPYEIPVILIANILRAALLKKVMDAFLDAEDKNLRIFKFVFAAYYLLITAAYCRFRVPFRYAQRAHLNACSFGEEALCAIKYTQRAHLNTNSFGAEALRAIRYEICNLAGVMGAACFYGGAWGKKLWISMVFLSMDMGCTAAVSLAGSPEIRMQESAVQVLLLLGWTVMICRIPDPKEGRKTALGKRQMFLLLMIPALSMLLFLGLMYGSVDRFLAVLFCAVIAALDLCVFYLYHILLKNYMQLREQDLYKQQMAAYENQLEVIMESQSRVRALRHDMKNHLLTLQGLAKGSQSQEMREYLASMETFLKNPSEHVCTGNEAVDSLLNYKLRKAEEVLKRVETDIVIPEKMKLRSFDLNMILGNLLDNGTAAAMETDDQVLKLRMRMANGVLFLYMANSCLGIPHGVCEIRSLSERSAPGHGTGLANIRKVVEKYYGDMEMRCEEDHMETEIMLYMKHL